MSDKTEERKVMLHKDNTIEFSWVLGEQETVGVTYAVLTSPFDGVTVSTDYGTAYITEFETWYLLGKEGEWK